MHQSLGRAICYLIVVIFHFNIQFNFIKTQISTYVSIEDGILLSFYTLKIVHNFDTMWHIKDIMFLTTVHSINSRHSTDPWKINVFIIVIK